MPADTVPYVPATPGDLITAEMWNQMQTKIRADITTTVTGEIGKIHDVDHAGDAAKLDGKTPRGLADEIVERALREMREKSGYRCIHTVLEAGKLREIEHGLGLAPLVDLYRMEYFPVVCREDDQTYLSWATYYLRHSSESRIRFTEPEGGGKVSVDLEEDPAFRVKLSDLVERYGVEVDDDMSLDALETKFWQAFFAAPNDGLDDDDNYGHSPWFERCCKEKKTVGQLKDTQEWGDLWLQMKPVKQALFLPSSGDVFGKLQEAPNGGLAPVLVDVFHTDFKRMALALRDKPILTYAEEGRWRSQLSLLPTIAAEISDSINKLKVMVLLKV